MKVPALSQGVTATSINGVQKTNDAFWFFLFGKLGCLPSCCIFHKEELDLKKGINLGEIFHGTQARQPIKIYNTEYIVYKRKERSFTLNFKPDMYSLCLLFPTQHDIKPHHTPHYHEEIFRSINFLA